MSAIVDTNRKCIDACARLLLLVLLAIKLSLHCQMCDPHFKFEEDRTKTAVAIENDTYFGQTDRTDRQTNIHSSDFVSVLLYLVLVLVLELYLSTFSGTGTGTHTCIQSTGIFVLVLEPSVLVLVLHRVSKKLCKIVFVRTLSNVHQF